MPIDDKGLGTVHPPLAHPPSPALRVCGGIRFDLSWAGLRSF